MAATSVQGFRSQVSTLTKKDIKDVHYEPMSGMRAAVLQSLERGTSLPVECHDLPIEDQVVRF